LKFTANSFETRFSECLFATLATGSPWLVVGFAADIVGVGFTVTGSPTETPGFHVVTARGTSGIGVARS
jgi:hypothetical protein